MSKYSVFFYLSLLVSITLFVGCEDDDPIINDEELITTINVVLTPQGGGSAVTFTFTDIDGDGGDEPIISGGVLDANTTYDLALSFLNESVTPVEDITEEIEEEDEEHQVFFRVAGDLDLTVTYADSDEDGNPIGLAATVATGSTTTSSPQDFTVILLHEPAKDAAGVKDGDLTNAAGETDAEATFPVEIQ